MTRGTALCILVAGGLTVLTPPAFAGQSTVFRTRRSTSYAYNPLAPLTVGAGIDFEKDSETKETAFPLQMEYGFSQRLIVSAELPVTFINSMDPDVGRVSGLDDLETTVEYEAIRERRYRPAFTASGSIRWPSSSSSKIGLPGRDYTVGFIASKDVVYLDLDLNILYTFSGAPEEPDILETSLGAAYPITYRWELQAEVVRTVGTSEPDRRGADEIEGTIGFSHLLTRFQTLEAGVLRKNDGTWGVLLGWQYSFGGE